MKQPTRPESYTPPWLLIIGLVLGACFIVFMAWDSISSSLRKSPHVTELTDDNWQREVVDSEVPVLVDFWAPWCGPCRQLSPTIDKLAERYKGKVKVGKLNVDNAQRIAAKYQISSIPRVMIFKGSDLPRTSFEGLQSEKKLAQAIDTVLAE